MQLWLVKEEINPQAVGVEEMPAEYLLSSNRTYVIEKTYNHEKSVKDEWRLQCFQEPHSEVHIKMLSRNHIMLIMRAWIQGARWNILHDTERNMTCCDGNGCLEILNFKEHNNGKELAEALEEGMRVEVLSWKLDVEEPGAASIISQALKQGQEILQS